MSVVMSFKIYFDIHHHLREACKVYAVFHNDGYFRQALFY